MSIVGVPMLLAPTLGPIIGGWLVDDVSWRWIFYVNVPIGALTLLLAMRILPRDQPQPTHRLDAHGLLLLSPGLALLVYALSETASSGGVTAAKVIVPFVVGAAMIVAFILRALRIDYALIDVRLFQNRT